MFAKPIVLAEDDANDVFVIRRYHNACGVHNPLHVVSDGEEVVDYFEGSRLKYPLPALLMVDWKMPGMGGLEILEYLKKKADPGFHRVFLTGNQDPELMKRAYELGASNESELLAALETYRNSLKYQFSALMVTDVNTQCSLLLVVGDEKFISCINYPRIEPGIYELKDIVSRKKQLLPYLTHCLDQMEN